MSLEASFSKIGPTAEDLLLIDRPNFGIRIAEGEAVLTNPEMERIFPRKPLMKCRLEEGINRLIVKMCGTRGSLLNVENKFGEAAVLAIKGCGLDDKGIDTTKEHCGQPYGGQLRSCALDEIKSTEIVNRVLLARGFPPAREPVGLFDYDGIKYEGEQCSASVFKVNGDTRLDEFINYVMVGVLHPGNIYRRTELFDNTKKLVCGIARYCGSIVANLYDSGMIWGTTIYEKEVLSNAHVGNFVLFPEKGSDNLYRVGMVDFDSQNVMKKAVPLGKSGSELMANEYESVISTFDSPETISNPGYFLRNGIVPGMPKEISGAFEDGFNEGYNGLANGQYFSDPVKITRDFMKGLIPPVLLKNMCSRGLGVCTGFYSSPYKMSMMSGSQFAKFASRNSSDPRSLSESLYILPFGKM